MGRLRSIWTAGIVLTAGLTAGAIGAIVLVGWRIHSILLIQVVPTAAPTQRMTALAFLLSGIAMVLAGAGRRRAAAVFALVVFLEATVVFLEYALNTKFGIDELLGRDYILVHVSHPGRMALVSTLCLLTSSLAILAMARPRPLRFASPIVGIMASALLAVGIVGILGYMLGKTELYGWSHFNRVGLPTSAGFAALGAGLLARAWSEGKTKQAAPEWLPFSIGLGLCAGALGVWQALIAREAGHFAALSGLILAGGFAGAVLIAFAVAQTQRSHKRSRELEASSATLHQLFESSPDGLLIVDRQGVILRVNRQAETIFGYGPNELLGSPIEDLVPARLRKAHQSHQERFHAAAHSRPMGFDRELAAVRKDGREIPVEIGLAPLNTPENESGVVAVVRDISERRQAQEALRQSEERFRSAFDHGPIGVTLLGTDYRMFKANPEMCRMFGYSEEELARMSPLEITHPADVAASINLMGHLFTDDVFAKKLEKRYIKKNGEVMWGSLSVGVIRDRDGRPLYAISMVEDITERKRVEEELRSLSERLSLATRTASIGIWDLDLRSFQAVWDDLCFEIFGISKMMHVSYDVFAERIHPEDLAEVEACLKRTIQGKKQELVEYRVIRPDGSVRHVSSAEAAVMDESGNVVRVVGTAVDITERRQMESQIEASKEQMLASARLSALGMMAGGVAHEINNPLSIIHASAADLQRRIKHEGAVPLKIAERDSARILHTANRITKIIKSMRHLAREGSHDRVRPTLVFKIVDETLEVCKERFKDHGVHLLLPSIDPALSVSCREVQIEQVLLNLLQNAFDAVVEQPEEKEKWIRLDVAPFDDRVEFSVTDSGPGIPPELRTKIMEPFFTTKEVGKGVGLGLSLSRKIVEEHGSRLELTEKSGHPCFSFNLPFCGKEELVCS
jgi:PAS domain S-box-containing protein